MASSKQAVLPLWGSAAPAHTVTVIARGHLIELCNAFLAAADAADESAMQSAVETMRVVVARLGAFQRAQFRKWAKERESQRK